ncbi:MAG: SRPBCC family protein [Chloroflexota bacterium]|nr:SRPBCC family protein [Chloroflexota bacterium]
MTRIEADAVLVAPPLTVWHVLVDGQRWPEWFQSPMRGLRLQRVSLRNGPPYRVGAEWDCAATLGPLPLLGTRELQWTTRIADVHCPWLLEFDVVLARRFLKRLRLRVILVDGQPGQTRLRWWVTYSPGALWLADWLFLRRALSGGVRRALVTLAGRWAAPPAGVLAPAPDLTVEPDRPPSVHPVHPVRPAA